MIHQKKRNSSKVNLTISFIVHAALIGGLVFFAAKEGLLGKKLKQLTVTMVPKEKKPEPPKEKPPEPKAEPPKPAEGPKSAPQAPKVETAATPPPAGNDAPVAAPPPAALPAFDFSDGAKEVQTISDPNGIYKATVEHALRSHWDRDEGIDDSQFAAEVEVGIDTKGKITDTRWLSLSGNTRWDAAVKNAVAQTKEPEQTAAKRVSLEVCRAVRCGKFEVGDHPGQQQLKKFSKGHHSSLNELNITPLLDLAFVLLVIFIITTPQLSNDLEMNLPSPKKEKPPSPPPKINRINVETTGRIVLNDQAIELPALKQALVTMKSSDPETTVVVRGAADVDYQRVISVLDALQQADITKIGLATETATQ